MWRLLERLGRPQERLPPVIHVAGTNGKGSTIAYLRAFSKRPAASSRATPRRTSCASTSASGSARTGGGGLIAEAGSTALLEECEAVNAGEPITFFEITTAAAFSLFARHPGRLSAARGGLGGRLDATNVIDRPLGTVITPIDIDHQQFLGDTLDRDRGTRRPAS